MTKKYTLVKSDTINCEGKKLFRIKAAVAIAALGISKGDLGGYIESEQNLSQVSDNAWVYGDARVYGDAQVSGNARVYGNARISGNAQVYGNAWVYGNARVYDPITMTTRTDGYTFLIAPTPNGPRIIAGCRYFTFSEARKHWTRTRGGTQLGEESLAIVDHLERMSSICGYSKSVE